VVCVGGGDAGGLPAYHREIDAAGIRIFGVEPELAKDTALSFAAGERVTIPVPERRLPTDCE